MGVARWKENFENLLYGNNEGVPRNRINIVDGSKVAEPSTLPEVKNC